MPNKNLIIAIVFAALFGAAILWLAIYHLHRFLHRKCHELGHWFHILLSHAHHAPEPEDYGHERAGHTLSSSAKSPSRRRSRGDTTSSKTRRRRRSPRGSPRGSPREEMRQRGEAWGVEMEEQRPTLTRGFPGAEYQPERCEWEGQDELVSEPSMSDAGPLMMPEAMRAAPLQMTPGAMRAAPPPMAPPLPSPLPTGIPPQLVFEPVYEQPYVEEYEPEESQHDTETITTLPPTPVPGKMDFIHICDEYPPMVLEALRQQETPANSSSESVPSSDSFGSTQQIPRACIPRASPRAAFQFSQYPYLQTRLCNTAPTSYPRQWMDKFSRREPEPPRYAPYMRAGGRRKLRDADRRRLAPIFELPKPPMGERWSRQQAARCRPEREQPELRSYGARRRPGSRELGRQKEDRGEVQGPGTQRPVDESHEKEQGAAPHEPEIPRQQPPPPPPPPPQPAQGGVVNIDTPAPPPLQWDALMRRTPRPYASSSGQGTQPPATETVPEAQAIEVVEEPGGEPERQPILLGMAPPTTDEAPAREPEPKPELGLSVPCPRQGSVPEHPISQSTFISSLHMSESVRGEGSEQRSPHSGEDARKRGGISGMVGEDRDRNAEAVVRGRESDILSSLNWETDRG
ncbi:hypothetical protein K458DRAFT_436279 [Lentithecium fluviatile CBS 122367]|uniref:Uncharacterized protein n=1 Tax=Lentithecium fluviatile CBS 122367 TaxID=1168545 RepID=A0A6G1II29_9PLEO|nr:hypothetical protein K458DRAFT_436279 [Lentithecium fluviatile CBS 122367]